MSETEFEFDPADLRVDFSSEEASSEALDFDPVPTGKYPVNVTDITIKACGPDSKNPGKPYWNVEMTIQDGNPYENKKLWANVMLFAGAGYSLAQLMKSTGYPVSEGTIQVPPADDIIGKPLIVSVVKQRDTYREQRDGGDPQWKNEVKGYKPYDEEALASTGGGGSDSLLP